MHLRSTSPRGLCRRCSFQWLLQNLFESWDYLALPVCRGDLPLLRNHERAQTAKEPITKDCTSWGIWFRKMVRARQARANQVALMQAGQGVGIGVPWLLQVGGESFHVGKCTLATAASFRREGRLSERIGNGEVLAGGCLLSGCHRRERQLIEVRVNECRYDEMRMSLSALNSSDEP